MIKHLPDSLLGAAKNLNADFIGYIAPGEENILGLSGDIPIKEVKINNNVAVLNPGEAAISGKFVLCSAVIGKKGDRLFVMHMYPNPVKHAPPYLKKIAEQGIIDKNKDDIFDQVLLIGREAVDQVENFSQLSKEPPQVLPIDSSVEGEFTVLVYNNPHNPGDVSSFDLWFTD